MASGDIENPANQAELSQWIQENLGSTADVANKMANELSQNTEELIEFGRALNETEEQSRAYYEAMATNVEQMVDMSKMSAEE
jgi:galactokinase